MPAPAKLLGAATAGYGVMAAAWPGHLTRIAGLPDDATTRLLARTLAARDLTSGALLLTAAPGRARRRALLVRAAFDLGDALAFGQLLPTTRGRRAVTVLALCSVAGCSVLAAAERDGR